MNKPVSAAASPEPGSEISSFVDSGDDFSDNLVVSTTGPLAEYLVVHESIGVSTNMAGTALPSTVAAMPFYCITGVALPLTPGTIQSIVTFEATHSVAGSSSMPLISMPPVTQATGLPMLLINMPAYGNAARGHAAHGHTFYYVS